ncbi:amino acid ABC transporter permease [Devosia sp. 2618]|uniref:amino acid ABC transporter permease n=1 Tax=Devosia sp. 2618 TaxID=3156454 RepID=UPI003394748C
MAAIVVYLWKTMPRRQLFGSVLIVLGPFFTLAALHGGFFGLRFVAANQWGGLLVTLVVGGLGILLSLPIGVLLALGRRSNMPLIRILSTIYIEVWRGVPLLGVLFMATLLLPLMLPAGSTVPLFYAVMAGIILYAAAYLAEVIRGGLLSIGRLQFEAADALGFGYWNKMRTIILPQALSNVLPAMVGIFIALFKSSTIVLVVGVFDLLGIVQNAAQNPDWAGFFTEGYLFVGLVFWVICYSVSMFGQSHERGRNRRNHDV